jgi:hypothetical protein
MLIIKKNFDELKKLFANKFFLPLSTAYRLSPKLIKLLFIMLFLILAITGCRQDMADQPKYLPLQPSDFFADGQAARPLVEGVVARGQLKDDTLFYSGKVGNDWSETFPMPVTKELVERGRQRFNIFCSPCHDQLGNGNGIIVQRGFIHPPSYYTNDLRNEKVGHLFDIVTNGFGAMPSYSAQVPARDRWAIVAYIRALQISQPIVAPETPADKRSDYAEKIQSGEINEGKKEKNSNSAEKEEEGQSK